MESWHSDFLAKSAAHRLQIEGVCVHIQSRADGDDGNGIMAMVMRVMMIVLVMVIIVPVALRQVDSVREHLYQTFYNL